MTDEAPERAAEPPTEVLEERPAGDPSPPPAPEPTSGLRFNDRTLVLGETGSGKSVLLNLLLSQLRCQRVLLDTKWEWTVDGIEPVSDVGAIDWTAPVIHYRDDRGDLADFDRLFEACLRRRGAAGYGLVVCVHELADLCGHSTGATPKWVNAYITKGRAHGLGLLGGSQVPVNMPMAAKTQAQHVFAFVPGFTDAEHERAVAKLMNLTVPQLQGVLNQAAGHGEHSYAWFDQRAKRIAIRPPLPDSLRARSIVKPLQ
jgi:hypothetical protein